MKIRAQIPSPCYHASLASIQCASLLVHDTYRKFTYVAASVQSNNNASKVPTTRRVSFQADNCTSLRQPLLLWQTCILAWPLASFSEPAQAGQLFSLRHCLPLSLHTGRTSLRTICSLLSEKEHKPSVLREDATVVLMPYHSIICCLRGPRLARMHSHSIFVSVNEASYLPQGLWCRTAEGGLEASHLWLLPDNSLRLASCR